MKLATFSTPGQDQPLSGVVDDGRVTAFGGPDGVREALAGEIAVEPGGESFDLADVTLLAPIRRPGTVWAIGLNYRRHAEEAGATLPERPLLFLKAAPSVTGPSGPVVHPQATRELDYEGELALVIGQGGTVAGYCVADDVSARDLQNQEALWVRGKGADTFCPFGPWVTTGEEIEDPEALRLRTWVNGELRQDSSTSDLIFGIGEIVDFIAATCTLAPGDLILTGTPSGVAIGFDPPKFLKVGDRIRIEIEGLGAIEHAVAGG
ncbi:MAG TPA: fumarylacetoacetate hydrolase family protein [Solirubrobacterales bacterium]|nr:fumarylacetoacetate hydrolase family protein [Solirubrobacterales bacterium]